MKAPIKVCNQRFSSPHKRDRNAQETQSVKESRSSYPQTRSSLEIVFSAYIYLQLGELSEAKKSCLSLIRFAKKEFTDKVIFLLSKSIHFAQKLVSYAKSLYSNKNCSSLPEYSQKMVITFMILNKKKKFVMTFLLAKLSSQILRLLMSLCQLNFLPIYYLRLLQLKLLFIIFCQMSRQLKPVAVMA